jgi:hypothetical protein
METPIDPYILALNSAFSSLVSKLYKKNSINFGDFIANIQLTSAEHARNGDHQKIGAALHVLSKYLLMSVPDTKGKASSPGQDQQ